MEAAGTQPSAAENRRGVLTGRYELGRVIGRGNFAKVHIARDVNTGASVAMKVVAKEKVVKLGMMTHLKREISVMRTVAHPNIISLREVLASRSKIYLAMELAAGGELFTRVARGGRLGESAARSYFRQLISAVDFCHSRGVYHRDLKPENLLLDGGGNLKVADFGLSAFADDSGGDGLLRTRCGTPAYVAPEVVGKRGYDGAKADLWSCGVILFVLLAGFLPFPDDNLATMYARVRRGDFRCPPWFSSGARRLVAKLLDPNPETRITVAALVETPWFKKSPIGNPTEASPAAEQPEAEKKTAERLNAFHLISLSDGLDLSPLFGKTMRESESVGVASRLAVAAGILAVAPSELAVVVVGGEFYAVQAMGPTSE